MSYMLIGCAGIECDKIDESVKVCSYINYSVKNYVYLEVMESLSKDELKLILVSSHNRYEIDYGSKIINFLIDGKIYSFLCNSFFTIGYGDNVSEVNSVYIDSKFIDIIVNSKKCLFNIEGKESFISKSDKKGIIKLLKEKCQ